MRLSSSAIFTTITSGLAFVAGSLITFVVTKNYVANQYEGKIEEEVAKAKSFYDRRHETEEDSETVAPVEVSVEADVDQEDVPAPHRPTLENAVKVELRDEDFRGQRNDYRKYNKLRSPYSGFDQSEGADNSMEAVEKRLIEAAKAEVDEKKRRSGEFTEEKDDMSNRYIDENFDRSDRDSDTPFVITRQEFEDNDLEYTQNTLSYFEGDKVLVDELEQPIQPASRVIGHDTLQFGCGSDDPNVVYIRNDHMQVDFEVVRSPGEYAVEVLGAMPPEVRRNHTGMY